jgi:hypothetical protein
MNRGYNVTMLEDLPDLEELEQNAYQPQQQPMSNEKLKKFIRGNHKIDPMAGMENRIVNQPQYMERNDNQYYAQQPIFRETQPVIPALNCIDIAKHIQDCPICSRFYNTDKTIYIVIIVLLLIICILLLKRVLNV